jgi:hypothetical protein
VQPTPHPLLGPLTSLIGVWAGAGSGSLPGGPTFSWSERLTVTHVGTPALSVQQRTKRADGSPFHAEDMWVRVPPELQLEDGDTTSIELVVTSPTGILEASAGIATGTSTGCVLDATTTAIARTLAAGEVLATRRRYRVNGDHLAVDFWMATPADPDLFHHLTAELDREPSTDDRIIK